MVAPWFTRSSARETRIGTENVAPQSMDRDSMMSNRSPVDAIVLRMKAR